MQYTVVHSKDPYLLARLATDLQMIIKIKPCRFVIEQEWVHPWDETGIEWLWFGLLEIPKNTFSLANHPCGGNPTRHELTSSNYIKVLTKILS